MSPNLGKTLLIANPASQNGKGAAAAVYAADVLRDSRQLTSFKLSMTEKSLHGSTLAAQASDYDTVIALGGDGLIHEVANGLMQITPQKRPVLGILPLGNGNDYARTLDMSFDPDRALTQIREALPKPFDVGCCNGEYFVQTLSFGLDAAIALDTVERRKRTRSTGTLLFVESGIDTLLHHLETYDFTASFDKGKPWRSEMLMFAVQVGPTYGGGFKICPDARVDDNLLDICIAHPPLGIPKAVLIFLLAKIAHHTGFKQLEFMRAETLTLTFEQQVPAQMDGEPFHADTFDINSVPAALQVLVPGK